MTATSHSTSPGPNRPAHSIRRVLIVDDSRAQLRVLSTLLERWGYEVETAMSGDAALAAFDARPADLIVSDWVMPGMSGLDLCRGIRAHPEGRLTYIILMTSKNAPNAVAIGLAAGADDFVNKPITSGEFEARLSAGERLLAAQDELREKNALLAQTLGELQGVHDSLGRDLAEARRLQQSLVPEQKIRFDGADVSLLLRPCGHVGGDLVGAFRVSETRIGLYALDVSGHGIASALMAARLASFLNGASPARNLALTIDALGLYRMRPPEEVCAELNRLVIEDMETEHYLTIVLVEVDLKTGRVDYALGGHPRPLVLSRSGEVTFHGAGGMPVGLIETAAYDRGRIDLAPGDRLLLYSDGLTECEGADGRQLEEDGLSALVRRNGRLRGPAFLDALQWEAKDRAGEAELADDISCVLLEFTGRGAP